MDTFGKKKKKKKVKKTTFNLDDLENNLPDSSSGLNESSNIENGDAHGDSNAEVFEILDIKTESIFSEENLFILSIILQEDFSLDMDFSKTKKKKKKKKDLDELVGEELERKQQEVRDEGN